MRGVKRFRAKGKLSPRFIGPFEVSGEHNLFHISMFRKYISDSTHVLSYEGLDLDQDLSYEEKPMHILDKKDKVLMNKTIPLVKVLWRNSKFEEATWELESDMRNDIPSSFRKF